MRACKIIQTKSILCKKNRLHYKLNNQMNKIYVTKFYILLIILHIALSWEWHLSKLTIFPYDFAYVFSTVPEAYWF